MLSSWSNYFNLGQVGPAYRGIDAHTTKRYRQWFRGKYKLKFGLHMQYTDDRLWHACDPIRLTTTTKNFPWVKA